MFVSRELELQPTFEVLKLSERVRTCLSTCGDTILPGVGGPLGSAADTAAHFILLLPRSNPPSVQFHLLPTLSHHSLPPSHNLPTASRGHLLPSSTQKCLPGTDAWHWSHCHHRSVLQYLHHSSSRVLRLLTHYLMMHHLRRVYHQGMGGGL